MVGRHLLVLLPCPYAGLLLAPPEPSPAQSTARKTYARYAVCAQHMVFQRIAMYKPKHGFAVAQKDGSLDMEIAGISASLLQLPMLKSC